jgi:hypothetical protein
MRQGAQHVMLRKGIPLLLVLVAAGACNDTATVGAAPPPSMAVSIPAISLGNMHEADSTKTAEEASVDATDSQAMLTILDGAGLLGVQERVYTGGRGSYSRVVVRAWEFSGTQGAGAFHDWLITNATHSVIGEAKPVVGAPVPALFVHEPSGCCHEETPIYLAAWQNGDVVWTVVASGPRIQTHPVIELVKTIEQEV